MGTHTLFIKPQKSKTCFGFNPRWCPVVAQLQTKFFVNGFYNRVISNPSFCSEISLNDVICINFSVSLNAIGLLLVDMFHFSFVPNRASIMRI